MVVIVMSAAHFYYRYVEVRPRVVKNGDHGRVLSTSSLVQDTITANLTVPD